MGDVLREDALQTTNQSERTQVNTASGHKQINRKEAVGRKH